MNTKPNLQLQLLLELFLRQFKVWIYLLSFHLYFTLLPYEKKKHVGDGDIEIDVVLQSNWPHAGDAYCRRQKTKKCCISRISACYPPGIPICVLQSRVKISTFGL